MSANAIEMNETIQELRKAKANAAETLKMTKVALFNEVNDFLGIPVTDNPNYKEPIDFLEKAREILRAFSITSVKQGVIKEMQRFLPKEISLDIKELNLEEAKKLTTSLIRVLSEIKEGGFPKKVDQDTIERNLLESDPTTGDFSTALKFIAVVSNVEAKNKNTALGDLSHFHKIDSYGDLLQRVVDGVSTYNEQNKEFQSLETRLSREERKLRDRRQRGKIDKLALEINGNTITPSNGSNGHSVANGLKSNKYIEILPLNLNVEAKIGKISGVDSDNDNYKLLNNSVSMLAAKIDRASPWQNDFSEIVFNEKTLSLAKVALFPKDNEKPFIRYVDVVLKLQKVDKVAENNGLYKKNDTSSLEMLKFIALYERQIRAAIRSGGIKEDTKFHINIKEMPTFNKGLPVLNNFKRLLEAKPEYNKAFLNLTEEKLNHSLKLLNHIKNENTLLTALAFGSKGQKKQIEAHIISRIANNEPLGGHSFSTIVPEMFTTGQSRGRS